MIILLHFKLLLKAIIHITALSLNAIELVLKELAAFHATGFHFINTYPGGRKALATEYPDFFTENFTPGEEAGKEMMSKFAEISATRFGSCVLVTKKYGSKELSTKMADYQKNVKSALDTITKSKWRMSFVTHGDAWYNNFLYRYLSKFHSNKLNEDSILVSFSFFHSSIYLYRYHSQNKSDPTDVSMVDLQGTRLGRPGVELAYFFCSSTSPKQRKEHFQTLIRFYYNEFSEQLKSLGADTKNCFTFEELLTDFDECYPYGFITGCIHAQVNLR